jgi:hypothetical protein
LLLCAISGRLPHWVRLHVLAVDGDCLEILSISLQQLTAADVGILVLRLDLNDLPQRNQYQKSH